MNEMREGLIALGLLPPPPPDKRCRHCQETKLRAEFPPNRKVSDGLSSWCRSCHREGTARWKARKAAADPGWRSAARERETK